jgi:DNA modification methylase
VAELVGVFREVKRVLRPDGVCFLNLGDSYAANRGCQVRDSKHIDVGNYRTSVVPAGLKPKDLMMIPARVALALQADGWWLRSDIIWAKPNPMPESVTDRPTSAHEHVFMLTKRATYFYNADAVQEQCESGPSDVRKMTEALPRIGGKHKLLVDPRARASSTTNMGQKRSVGHPSGRNLRNVWTIATAPYPEAHFATFPPELAERCIKAGSRPGDTVLDPFAGAFTAPLVADRLQRHAIGIELSPAYCAMARARLIADAGMFAQFDEAAND